MSRALLILHTDDLRAKAIDWIRKAPVDTRVTFQGPKRTLAQNDRMWAMLTDVSVQLEWHGAKRSPEDWKLLFLDSLERALGHEPDIVPSLYGDGYVRLDGSSSKLSVEEMTQLIELIFAFGSNHGVTFQEPDDGAHPTRKRNGKDNG